MMGTILIHLSIELEKHFVLSEIQVGKKCALAN